jgi:predicted alpha/beta-hydrolase family hydrolase
VVCTDTVPRRRPPDHGGKPASGGAAGRNVPGVVTVLDIDTPHGPARAHLHDARAPRGALVLGHGAGGGIAAPDLVAVTGAALAAGYAVAQVEQPYRVAGRRSPAPARQLDAAWIAVVEHLRTAELAGLPLLTGGRSSGARVACRTAATTGAVAVLCLAFPLHPPGRPEKTRLPELDAVECPVLIVQGDRDPFGRPPAAPGREVVVVSGDHGLARDLGAVAAPVGEWLAALLRPAARTRATRGRATR